MELGSSDAVVWMCMAVGWRRKDEPEAKRQKSRPSWRASPSFSKLLVYPMTLVSAEGKRSVQR